MADNIDYKRGEATLSLPLPIEYEGSRRVNVHSCKVTMLDTNMDFSTLEKPEPHAINKFLYTYALKVVQCFYDEKGEEIKFAMPSAILPSIKNCNLFKIFFIAQLITRGRAYAPAAYKCIAPKCEHIKEYSVNPEKPYDDELLRETDLMYKITDFVEFIEASSVDPAKNGFSITLPLPKVISLGVGEDGVEKEVEIIGYDFDYPSVSQWLTAIEYPNRRVKNITTQVWLSCIRSIKFKDPVSEAEERHIKSAFSHEILRFRFGGENQLAIAEKMEEYGISFKPLKFTCPACGLTQEHMPDITNFLG